MLGGSSIEMSAGSMVMIHDPWTLTVGDEAEHAKAAATLGKIADNLADLYAAKSGKASSETRADMQKETWLTASEAVEYGLADKIGDDKAKAFAIPDGFGYRNTPMATGDKQGQPGTTRGKLSADAKRRKIQLTKVQFGIH